MLIRSPTIKDVANTAGVSIATVSNVIRGKSTLFSDPTGERVRHAIRELNYNPNHTARSLVSQSTKTLGVVVPKNHGRLTSNTYLSAMMDGFLEFSVAAGYQTKIISLVNDDKRTAIALVEDGSTDGVALLAPPEESPLLSWIHKTRIPTVVAGNIPPDLELPSVDVDDISACCEAVSWLISMGHRKIGLITGDLSQWSSRRRESGYRRALDRAGILFNSEIVFQGDYNPPSGEAGSQYFMRIKDRVTAIFCANDWMALGAMLKFQKNSVRVPEDISIIGFDDIQIAQWTAPTLTTMHQPIHEIGMKVAEMLIEQIQTGSLSQSSILLPATLVIRQSVQQI